MTEAGTWRKLLNASVVLERDYLKQRPPESRIDAAGRYSRTERLAAASMLGGWRSLNAFWRLAEAPTLKAQSTRLSGRVATSGDGRTKCSMHFAGAPLGRGNTRSHPKNSRVTYRP